MPVGSPSWWGACAAPAACSPVATASTSGRQRLTAVLSATCSVPPDEAWQLASVAGAIDGLGEQATVGGAVTDVALDVREVAAVLDASARHGAGRLRTRSGDVLLTGLVPLRNVPARVVCLLGADADSMRPATVDGDDLLARRPCVGERDRRAELRHGLLDAFMAASDRVIITCDGVDVATNRPVRPSVALAELLDVVRATVDDDAVVVHHRRRAYDEQLFVADATAPSFDDAMLAVATARRTTVVTPTWASRFDAPLPLLVPAEVDLEQLTTVCTLSGAGAAARSPRRACPRRLRPRRREHRPRALAVARRRARPRPARSTAGRRWRRS